LGNIVTRKKRKRVEGSEVKDTQRVSGQRLRQRIRVVWDRFNREIRKKYRKYRKSGKREKSEILLRSRKGLIQSRERYRVLREAEVYRNSYEVRSRMETHERGERRKNWRLEAKYRTTSPLPAAGSRSGKKTWIESHVREGLRLEESDKRDGFHEKRLGEFRRGFQEALNRRESTVIEKKERRKIGHIRSLLERSKETRKKPIQRKNRVQRFSSSFVDEQSGKRIEGDLDHFQSKDDEVEIRRALPTTQYFAKVKNLTRRRERRSDQRDEKGLPTIESERVKKRRKVPEKKRNQRYPHWTELEVWSNQLMQKVEDANLQKVLKGEEVDLSYATYRELGKKVVYLYAVERSERWRKKKN